MSQANKIRLHSVEEYCALERASDVRHEYLNGEIVAMGGASRAHNTIVFNLGTAIRPRLRGTRCRIAGNDRKVYITKANRAYYPDLVVSCSDVDDEIDDYTETRPRLIVEVLSPSTESIDRRQKRIDHQMLDSLQDYVLVAQDRQQVEVYRREDDGRLHTVYGPGDSVELASLDLRLSVDTVYEDVL